MFLLSGFGTYRFLFHPKPSARRLPNYPARLSGEPGFFVKGFFSGHCFAAKFSGPRR
jgi:hypothetical protein